MDLGAINEVITQFGAFGVLAFALLYLLRVRMPQMQAEFTLHLSQQREDYLKAAAMQREEFLASTEEWKQISWDHTKEERRAVHELMEQHHNEMIAALQKLTDTLVMYLASASKQQH